MAFGRRFGVRRGFRRGVPEQYRSPKQFHGQSGAARQKARIDGRAVAKRMQAYINKFGHRPAPRSAGEHWVLTGKKR